MEDPQHDVENIDEDLLAEQKLSLLQRQYRCLELDKTLYSGNACEKLKRQTKALRTLKAEQKNILIDLKLATSVKQKKIDNYIQKNLENLLKEYECMKEQLETENNKSKELDFQIYQIENKVNEMKKISLTDEKCQERLIAGQQRVTKLENQLETKIKQFNIVVADNYELRNEIDHLLKEREYFNKLWNQLINSLNQGKKYMLDLIEQASLAYDCREDWCNKLGALRERGNREMLNYTRETRRLQRKINYKSKLDEFLGKKGQIRILHALESREEKTREMHKQNMEKTLLEYKQALEKIKEFCGDSDIKKLAKIFMKQEDENFALFNFANQLNNETELLSYALLDLKQKTDEQRELNATRKQQQKNNILLLEKKTEEMQNNAHNLTHKLREFDTDLEILYNGINNMFKLLKCDKAPILELLGDHTRINAYNVMMFLGLIENRTTQLLQQVYYLEITELSKRKKIQVAQQVTRGAKHVTKATPPQVELIKPDIKDRYIHLDINDLVHSQPCPLCVEQELVSDVIDTLQHAQSQEEVAKVLNIRLKIPQGMDRLHNVSACHLPQSRKIIQKRYQ